MKFLGKVLFASTLEFVLNYGFACLIVAAIYHIAGRELNMPFFIVTFALGHIFEVSASKAEEAKRRAVANAIMQHMHEFKDNGIEN